MQTCVIIVAGTAQCSALQVSTAMHPDLFKALVQYQAGQHLCRPMLYGIMSATADRARATHSFQQKFYQVQSTASCSQKNRVAWGDPSTGLSPIQLSISNLGVARQTRSYEALTPVASLPPVHLQLPGRRENGEPALCHNGGTKLRLLRLSLPSGLSVT